MPSVATKSQKLARSVGLTNLHLLPDRGAARSALLESVALLFPSCPSLKPDRHLARSALLAPRHNCQLWVKKSNDTWVSIRRTYGGTRMGFTASRRRAAAQDAGAHAGSSLSE